MTFLQRLWMVGLVGIAAAGCGGTRGAEPDEIQEHLDEVVTPLVDDSNLAFEYLADSEVLADLEAAVQVGEEDDGFDDEWEDEEAEPEDPNAPTPGEELSRFLRENIFTEDNHEGDGVYRVRGSDVCPREVVIDDPEQIPEPAVDEDCVRMVDEAEIRIEVLIVDGGFDVTLLVGPDRSRPIRLESRGDRITLVLDLGEARAAIEHVADVVDEDVELPEVLEGVIAVTLRHDGDQAATIELDVREQVSVQADTEEGHFALDVGVSEPAARLSVDAIARRIEAATDLGRVVVELPWSMLEEETEVDGTLRIDLPGATATASIEDGERELRIDGVSLGDDTLRVTLDDQLLFALDLNPDEGRSLDVVASPTDEGLLVSVDPAYHVIATVDTRPILEPWDDPEPAADGDTYEITLDGDDPAVEILDSDDAPDAIRVVSGHLSIEATDAEPIEVEAGECLLEDELEEGEHPALGELTSGPCP